MEDTIFTKKYNMEKYTTRKKVSLLQNAKDVEINREELKLSNLTNTKKALLVLVFLPRTKQNIEGKRWATFINNSRKDVYI